MKYYLEFFYFRKKKIICSLQSFLISRRFIYDLLLQEVRTADGIKVYQNSLERLRVDIDFLNTKVIVTGNSKYMQMLIAKSIKLREEIKTAKHLQLKMEGF